MHKVPWFSRQRHTQKAMKSEQKLSRPRLERRYAVKDIEYEVSDSSTSSSSSSVLRARSLDLLPLIDNTSFRIEGNDSKFEIFCRSLGLKGPEDFEIPVEAWEAMKLRSSSDVLPTSGWRSQFDGIDVQSQQVEVNELSGTFADRVSSAPEPGEFNTSRNGAGDGLAVSSRFNDKIIVRGVRVNDNDPVGRDMLVQGGGGLRGGGIKGVRPPVLASPSYLNRDRSSPEIDEKIDDEISKREGTIDLRITEAAAISEALFTTTSNDDDSSSTSTEPTSSISPNVRIRRTISSWDKGELLGRGSFGSVYEGIADGGFFFAVKEVSLLDQGEWGRQSIFQLEQEIALLSQFQHENIVLYYGTKKDESNLYIFLELVKGSLLNLYHKYNLRDSQVSEYTRQILHGLKYLHDRKVVHRDIKCANILYDASGSVKLADFGLAKATKLNDVKSCKGTAFWMAPEVVNRKNQGYGLAADIWSLGCTVLEMLTHQLPYYPLDCMQALFRIGKGIPPPIPDSLSGDARDFINDCLQVDPSARPTALQLLDHSFVKRT